MSFGTLKLGWLGDASFLMWRSGEESFGISKLGKLRLCFSLGVWELIMRGHSISRKSRNGFDFGVVKATLKVLKKGKSSSKSF